MNTREIAEQIIKVFIATQGDIAACPHCGEDFTNEMLRDDKRVPTHDWPKPCRQVCPGTGRFPVPSATPLIEAIGAALTKAIADERATPIPMVLHCPNCHEQHVDQPESERLYHRRLSNAMPAEVRPRWTNPPHKSHLCHNCGTIWRPADVATTGVESIQTRGKADTWPTIRRDDTADTEGEGR